PRARSRRVAPSERPGSTGPRSASTSGPRCGSSKAAPTVRSTDEHSAGTPRTAAGHHPVPRRRARVLPHRLHRPFPVRDDGGRHPHPGRLGARVDRAGRAELGGRGPRLRADRSAARRRRRPQGPAARHPRGRARELPGAAADRRGQRPVILVAGIVNSLALLTLAAVAFSSLPDIAVLAVGFLIGASSPQIGPFSRTRLVQLILTRLPSARRAHSLSGTMGYESAADETAFVFGPLVVGLLATTLNPAAPMIGAAVLTLVFVTAFALHPTAKVAAPTHGEPAVQAPARELRGLPVLVVVAGALGVGLFFGTVLTSLTAFLADSGRGDSAGLVYGVMG